MKRHLIYIGILAALLASCGQDDYTAEPQAQQTDVPLTITLATAWESDGGDTRAAPPGAGGTQSGASETTSPGDDGWTETQDVDRVRVVTFRRPTTGHDYGSDQMTGFTYDALNDLTLNVTESPDVSSDDTYPATHKHRRAHGRLRKTYGFEYRVVAIAYRSHCPYPFRNLEQWDDESQFFTLNTHEGLTLADFQATVHRRAITSSNWEDYLNGSGTTTHNTGHLTGAAACPPQLFYGYLHTERDENPVIDYAVQELSGDYNPALPLTGTLLRGMAKVEVRIAKVDRVKWASSQCLVNWVALLSDNVISSVRLDSYDRFTDGYASFPPLNKADTHYDAIDYHASAGENTAMTLTAYLLPTKTRLAMRVRVQHLPGYDISNGEIWVRNASTGDTPTGVISPDALSNFFFLRRNHKYVVNIARLSLCMDNAHDADGK